MCGKMIPGQIVYAGTGGHADEDKETSALLECFLVHTRVLLEFFCKERPTNDKWPDDVYAGDFLPAWDVSKCKSLCPYLVDQWDRLHKSVAHLSAKRVEYERTGKSWEITTIETEITPLMELFKSQLPSDQRTWFVYCNP